MRSGLCYAVGARINRLPVGKSEVLYGFVSGPDNNSLVAQCVITLFGCRDGVGAGRNAGWGMVSCDSSPEDPLKD